MMFFISDQEGSTPDHVEFGSYWIIERADEDSARNALLCHLSKPENRGQLTDEEFLNRLDTGTWPVYEIRGGVWEGEVS
jgi:hypothetical protein